MPGGAEVDGFAERLGGRLVKEIDGLEESAESIGSTFGTAVLLLHARCLADPTAAAAETREALFTATQLGAALFALTGTDEGTVECAIVGKVRVLPAVGASPAADAGNWLTAFWLAVVCRDGERTERLCQVPLERLRSAEGAAYDAFIYHWVDVLQTFRLGRPGLVDKLIATIEASDPAKVEVASQDLLQGVLYPPINLFYLLARKDMDNFGPALADALKLHRAYWTMVDDRREDINSTFALAPLAIACLAFDAGIPLDVESDYLPEFLLQPELPVSLTG